MNYADAGVVEIGQNLSAFFKRVENTGRRYSFGERGHSTIGLGHYASVIHLDNAKSIAMTTDGVGSKILVARDMRKWDTIGYDCVAMNVNDLLSVGATPLSMLDYIATDRIDIEIFEEIARGLADGAAVSQISISGGEIAQVPEIVNGIDLSGTALGVIEGGDHKIITGWNAIDSAIIGLRSNGVHCNGLTLARKVLSQLGENWLEQKVSFLWNIGQELLNPTRIYVRGIRRLLESDCRLTGIAHITGGGLTNLLRLYNNVTYRICELPPRMAIFDWIQEVGNVPVEEMFRVFNMGVGMVVLVKKEDANKVMGFLSSYGEVPFIMGETINDGGKRVIIEPYGLVCDGYKSEKTFVKME